MDIDSDMYTIALYWNEYEWKCIYIQPQTISVSKIHIHSTKITD